MPFLFEQSADYTELLIPGDLLADDSVRDKAVRTLTAEVCSDVEVIGWLYQFYISDRKDEVFAGFKKGKKAGVAEIPAATQLFTPDWIVRYLVENSLGRLWLLNHPDSDLRKVMEYYIDPVDEEADYLRITSPEEIKIIDPACGSGHMLTYAFDLLYAIYEEEGYPPSEIPGLIVTHNLYGTEIDPRAGELAAFAITMKAQLRQKTFLGKGITPNILILRNIRFTTDELEFLRDPAHENADENVFWNLFDHSDLFGSLVTPNEAILATALGVIEHLDGDDIIVLDVRARAETVLKQATQLTARYHIVIANPPYMGAGNMNAPLSEFVRHRYPESKNDLYAVFIQRNLQLNLRNGLTAMITMQSWMFLSGYRLLRNDIARQHRTLSMIHLGVGAFDSIGGEVVSTTAFVIQSQGEPSLHGSYFRLTAPSGESEKSDLLRTSIQAGSGHVRKAADFSNLPGEPIAYWLEDEERALYQSGRLLKAVATTFTGIQTGDNDVFFRRWSEVSAAQLRLTSGSDCKWVPINKGGGLRRWYGNREFVVNWAGDAQELRDRESWTTRRARISGSEFFFRSGATWSRISPGPFAARMSDDLSVYDNAGSGLVAGKYLPAILAFLNSTAADRYLEFLAPTVNTQPGDIERLPQTELLLTGGGVTKECVAIAKRDWDSREDSWDFASSPLLRETGSLQSRIAAVRAWRTSEVERLRALQRENDQNVATALGLDPLPTRPRSIEVTLFGDVDSSPLTANEHSELSDMISYAVGNVLGRYSLDSVGTILADQGDTFDKYVELIPVARFLPDRDNVIPIVDGDWFEDDIVARFREWLKVAFGAEHLQDNWQYIKDTLGKSIRQYFVKDFYADHVKRYKKRPIYWLFSSPKGTFNALIYMHRYTPATVGTVLHDYVLPFLTKLETELGKQVHLAASADSPRAAAAATKQAETLRKQILEVRDWATETLHPLADQQLVIDLDDGVKHNYPRFGQALKKIPGLDTQ